MADNESDAVDRRHILKAIAVGLTLGGCAPAAQTGLAKLSEPTATQRARKREGRSSLAIVKVGSYDENIFEQLKPYIEKVGLPDLKGQKVILKPNMVEIQGDKPIWTNPAIVKAAVEVVGYLGAKEITVAEGAGHMRDTEYLLTASGIGPMLKKIGVPFVDLNLDDVVSRPNPDNFSGLDPIWLPKTVANADAVVSLPKMKTHHWVGVTASMKNLFGTFPGRKYGWPKNVLHIKGIPNCIIDINNLVRPKFAIVDAIVAMEGDGPINGTAINTGFVVMGCDLAAIDATCARAMKYVPEEMAYLARAGQVLGNIDPAQIDIHGCTLAEVTHDFRKPITYYNKQLLAESTKSGS